MTQGLNGEDFDVLISWFQQGPQFAAAWSHYRQHKRPLDGDDIYQLVQ